MSAATKWFLITVVFVCIGYFMGCMRGYARREWEENMAKKFVLQLKKKVATCPKCGQPYEMGYNGVVDGCDACMGVQRDPNGYAWYPGETENTYQAVGGGEPFTVARDDAMKGKNETRR